MRSASGCASSSWRCISLAFLNSSSACFRSSLALAWSSFEVVMSLLRFRALTVPWESVSRRRHPPAQPPRLLPLRDLAVGEHAPVTIHALEPPAAGHADADEVLHCELGFLSC